MGFDREVTNILNSGLDFYNCLISLVMLAALLPSIKTNKATRNLVIICVFLIFFDLGDLSNWLSEGSYPKWKTIVLPVFTFVFYASVPFIFIFFMKYIEEFLQPVQINPWFVRSGKIVAGLYLIGLLITPFTGFYYEITPDNYYLRGKFNFVGVFFDLLFYLDSSLILFMNKKHFRKGAFFTFLTFAFLPISTEIIQLFLYGISLVNSGMTFSILLIYVNLHRNLEETLEQASTVVKEKEKTIISMQEHTIISLSNLVENRDTDTGEHVKRTSLYVALLAKKTLEDKYYTDILNENYIRLLVKAAPMHDIGKITVPDKILKKPGRLDQEEYAEMQIHAKEGGRIVNDILGISSDKEYIRIASEMAESHHEKWDGTGYPNHLTGENIPLSARIMAVADVFDALVSERCYKRPVSPEAAFEILEEESGTHFDPILVREFLKCKEGIYAIIRDYQD